MKGYTPEDKALTSLQNYGSIYTLLMLIFIILIIKLIFKRFQRLRHVQPDLDILFVKLTTQIGDRLH